MAPHAAVFEALAEQIRSFVRQPSCRLLHVVASADLRKSAVAAVMAAEHAPENRSAFVRFDAPHTDAAPGWLLRTDAARSQHDARRDGAEPPIPALPPAPAARDGLVSFAEQLWQLLERRPPGSEGLVVVLAPTAVESPKAWAADLGRLVLGRSLSEARFVVVDVHRSTIDPVLAKLGPAAIATEVRTPTNATAEALLDRLDGGGGATPAGVTPPARPDVLSGEPTADALLRKQVGQKVLAAALAMGTGDASTSVTEQRQARDLCAAAGWTAEATRMELVLGGHLMAAGQTDAAEASFTRALATARDAGDAGSVAIAGFAVGAVRLAGRERHTALVAYAEAAIAAEHSGDPMLAIEGNRLAGQAAADIKMEPQAITFFTRAVKLAEVQAPHTLARTTASLAARGLATICRKRRLTERAQALEAQAERFATPVALPPPAAVPEPVAPAVPDSAPAPEPAPEPAEATLPHSIPDSAAAVSLWDGDASIPPPDLLADLPAPPPPLDTPVPLPLAPADDFSESTSLLTLAEISRLHWAKPGSEVRPWTDDEVQILQRAVNDALEPEATTMLSLAELAALRGEHVPPPDDAPLPPPRLDVAPDDGLAGLEPVEPQAAPPQAKPAPARGTAFDPDEVTMLSLDEVAKLRKAFEDQKKKP